MPTWHITITFQAPRGAEITDDVVADLHETLPGVSTVSHMPDNRLEFMLHADSPDSSDLYTLVYQRVADACTDVLGFPVEFLHSEVAEFGYWLDQIDPNGNIRMEEG